MPDIILKATHISKQYRLGTIGTGTISHDLNRWWHKVRGKDDPFLKVGETNDRSTKAESDYVWALKDINFEVKRGEVLGIIGKNGAGKSTLLKILSRVTSPTTGEIKTKGRIASLLEVGTGFHGEMTGRENIFLNGAILGMTKTEIRSKIDEIIDFSGCERYIDTPVKRYSSGMTVRLAFAVAAFLEPDILVIDEVLAVGDAEFQKKAIGKMQDISHGEGRTVLFVSHDMGAVKRLCNRVLLLNNGVVDSIGQTNDIVDNYLTGGNNSDRYILSNDENGLDMCFKSVFLIDSLNIEKNTFSNLENINVKTSLEIKKYKENSSLYIMVLTKQGTRVFSAETRIEPNKKEYILTIEPNFLAKGFYCLELYIHIPQKKRFDEIVGVCSFNVIEEESQFIIHGAFNHGVVFGKYKWE